MMESLVETDGPPGDPGAAARLSASPLWGERDAEGRIKIDLPAEQILTGEMREQRDGRPRARRNLGRLRHEVEDALVVGRSESERHVRRGARAAQRGGRGIVGQADRLERDGTEVRVAREPGAGGAGHDVVRDARGYVAG